LPGATLGRRSSLLDTAWLLAIVLLIGTTPVTLAAAALLLMSKVGCAADAQGVAPDQIREGAELFAVNCSPCHGPRMQGSESAFDLRKFPPEQRDRFLSSVTRGRESNAAMGRYVQSGAARCAVGLRDGRRAVNVHVAQEERKTARDYSIHFQPS